MFHKKHKPPGQNRGPRNKKKGSCTRNIIALFVIVFCFALITFSVNVQTGGARTRLHMPAMPSIPAVNTLYEKDASGVPKAEESADDRPHGNKIHIIFSSGCTRFQHWQSLTLLHSASMTNPRPDNITRIISGCDGGGNALKGKPHVSNGGGDSMSREVVSREQVIADTPEGVSLFFTPTFDGADAFPWMNKPLGINLWMQTVGLFIKEDVISILDPDFIFMQPHTQRDDQKKTLKRGEVICSGGCNTYDKEISDQVLPGRPIGQRYGLNGGFLAKYNREEICGKGSHCAEIEYREAVRYYSMGPPMMVHKTDAGPLFKLWEKLMPAVYAVDPHDLINDMWAYSMASAHLHLPHLTLDHFMISSARKEGVSDGGEGWKWVNDVKSLKCSKPDINPGPTFIHMAQTYASEEWLHHKGLVPPFLFTCSSPLMKVPPEDLYDRQTKVRSRHGAFVICTIIYHVNAAVLDWKEKHCEPGYETRKMFKIKKHGTNCSKKNVAAHTTGWPCWSDVEVIEPGPGDE